MEVSHFKQGKRTLSLENSSLQDDSCMLSRICFRYSGCMTNPDSPCSHGSARRVPDSMEFFCLECGATIDIEGNTLKKAEVATVEPVKTKSAKGKHAGRRRKPIDTNPLPMGVLSEHVDRAQEQPTAREVLPTAASGGVEADAKRQTTKAIQVAQSGGMKQYTSADPDLPRGPWHGIPCPNRGHKVKSCVGIMETTYAMGDETSGFIYCMRCPVDAVSVTLSFQQSEHKQ